MSTQTFSEPTSAIPTVLPTAQKHPISSSQATSSPPQETAIPAQPTEAVSLSQPSQGTIAFEAGLADSQGQLVEDSTLVSSNPDTATSSSGSDGGLRGRKGRPKKQPPPLPAFSGPDPTGADPQADSQAASPTGPPEEPAGHTPRVRVPARRPMPGMHKNQLVVESREAQRRQAAIDHARARTWLDNRKPDEPARVVVLCSGAPGVGKTHQALEAQARYGGTILEPTHTQARERMAEALIIRRRLQFHAHAAPQTTPLQKVKVAGNWTAVPTTQQILETKQYKGLAKECSYFRGEDPWTPFGWHFHDVACNGCPQKKLCPSIRQFWNTSPANIGVHSMKDWALDGTLILDELPAPVECKVYQHYDLTRHFDPIQHRDIAAWCGLVRQLLNNVLNSVIQIASLGKCPPFGEVLNVQAAYPTGSSQREELLALREMIELNPPPSPNPQAVRIGGIKPENWAHGELESLISGLVLSLSGTPSEAPTHPRVDVIVYGDGKGNFSHIEYQARKKWTPPARSHVVLDSSYHPAIYGAIYNTQHHEIKAFNRKTPLDDRFVESVQYQTLGFSRKRMLRLPDGGLRADGVTHLVRFFYELRKHINHVKGAHGSSYRPKVGIVTHKGVLDALNFRLDSDHSTFDSRRHTRSGPSVYDEVEEVYSRVLLDADVVFGYYGGVLGSNVFNACDIMVALGDCNPNITAAKLDAQVLRLDAENLYIPWVRQKNAIQTLYRCRPLDADDSNRRLLLYFGRHDLTIPGLDISKLEFATGRMPSVFAREVLLALHEEVIRPDVVLFGTVTHELVGLHETSIGSALQAFRAAQVNPEDLTRAQVEAYRRAVEVVSHEYGLTRYERPHPLGGRRPLVLWSRSAERADRAVEGFAVRLGMCSPERVAELTSEVAVARREAQEERQDHLATIINQAANAMEETTEEQTQHAEWVFMRDLAEMNDNTDLMVMYSKRIEALDATQAARRGSQRATVFPILTEWHHGRYRE